MFEFVFMMAPQAGAENGNPIMGFLPFILIIVIMYFLMIRPQMKKQKERQKLLENLNKGDDVVTTGGIHGKIMGFNETDKTVLLKVDEKLKLHVDRSAIAGLKGQVEEKK